MSEEPDDADDWEAVDDEPEAASGPGDGRGDTDHAGALDERERQLNKRERELEKREQEVLERREETVERTEALDQRERELDKRESALADRVEALEERERELDQREGEIDAKREALQEYFDQGGADAFTYKPRVTAAFLLWITAVAAALLAVGTFLYGSDPNPPLISTQLLSSGGALGLAAVFGAAALVELVGGFTTYYGRSWFFSVFAGIVAIVVLLPVGLTAVTMITVGESGFD